VGVGQEWCGFFWGLFYQLWGVGEEEKGGEAKKEKEEKFGVVVELGEGEGGGEEANK